MIFISIIIPTRNRPKALASCLEAICSDARTRNDVEIIVVDDCSDAAPREANRQICSSRGTRYRLLERRGRQSVARNAGLGAAIGTWVAFVDDDVVADAAWLAVARRATAEAGNGVVGIEGRVEPSGNGLWDREVQNRRGGLFLTANIIYRRESLAAEGGFDETLRGFCEDHELAVRMQRRGRIVFDPALSGTHLPRSFDPLRLIVNAPGRTLNLLRSEFLFWRKHPREYGAYRMAESFSGTYRRMAFLHTWISFRRRSLKSLLGHPIQAVVLLVVCLVEQATAITLALTITKEWR
jgi:glycosyltransferase involved in cell wall biosynthesis